MERQKLQIANPCSEDFEEMEGDGSKRFCDKCDKHVHNLSRLSRAEAVKLLRDNAESGLCVVYLFDSADRVTFRDDVGARRAPRRQLAGLKKLLAAAAMVPMLAGLPACDTSVRQDPAVIEQPCDRASASTFRPIEEIRRGEERFMRELRDFLGFAPDEEPEVTMIVGAMPAPTAPPPSENDRDEQAARAMLEHPQEPIQPSPTPETPEPAVEPEANPRMMLGDIADPSAAADALEGR